MDVIHTAVWVSDLDEMLSFYVDVLGLNQTTKFEFEGVTNSYVAGEDGTELQFKYDPTREHEVEASGIDHLALEVENVDAEFERIVDASDCTVVRDPTTVSQANARVAFIEDPGGYVVELVQYLSAN